MTNEYGFGIPLVSEEECKLQERIAELEKENADLLFRVEHTRRDGVELLNNERKRLTKAKELLKRCYDNYIYLQPLRGDIGQFLSEVEK